MSGFGATGSPRGRWDGTLRSHPMPEGAWPIGRVELLSEGRVAGSAGIHDQTTPRRGMKMKMIQAAALLSLSVGSMALGQQAVQWKVSDGGNGHWYSVSSFVGTWPDVRDWCGARGSHLATLTSAEEWLWVKASLPVAERFVGGYQDRSNSDYQEPSGGWRWVTGEEFSLTSYMTLDDCPGGSTGSCGCGTPGAQDVLFFTGCCNNVLDDVGDGIVANCDSQGRSGIVEWSADCNNDGIVDYGQCRDGSLPDYNGNNIPDCCEQGNPCVVGNYPVQWRVSEGGNGHWYQVVGCAGCCFSQSMAVAVGLGAQLASLDLAGEQARLLELIPSTQAAKLGGFRTPNSDLFSGWQWLSGEPFNPSLVSWAQGNPGCCGPDQYWLYLQATPGGGYGLHDGFNCSPQGADFVVMEWSADCNNDGIVDKGQILTGHLADSDSDGIPNVCDCVCDVFRDFNVNGIDLGILLGQWGPSNQFTVTDFNGDGSVDGSDLGQLLAAWGPCPN